MNIAEILRDHATTRPEVPAIIDTYCGRRRVTTFVEMEAASVRMAVQLQDAGLQPGDAVLVFHAMSAELYIILAAIFRLGLVAMFLDPGQGRDYIEQCCTLHPPKALIASPKAHLLRLTTSTIRYIPHKFIITGTKRLKDWSLNKRAKHNLQSKIENRKSKIDRPALLTFTSGSTGQPKAALRTHGFLLAQHRVLADSLRLTTGQVDLTTMPIVALANLASGVTSVIPKADLRYPGKINPAPVVAQIQAESGDQHRSLPCSIGAIGLVLPIPSNNTARFAKDIHWRCTGLSPSTGAVAANRPNCRSCGRLWLYRSRANG